MQNKTVFVGLSGGVDSSVAAARLIDAGYTVVGVFIKVWHPDFMVCNWEQERVDAMRVAAHLGIPFLTCDAEAAYRDEVAAYFIESYRLGITPNPDVMCNQKVKFGAFLRFALEHGADAIATGHYAQITHDNGHCTMRRGIDTEKDQSYFLWTLNQDQLAKTLFPIGDTKKEDIRHEATTRGLPTAFKADSQGVCFLGHVDIPSFLSHYIELIPGSVINEAGEVIGTHEGAYVYTIGQRHGFTITSKSSARTPHYISGRNTATNTLTVSEHPPISKKGQHITLTNTVLRHPLVSGTTYHAQSRYRQKPFLVNVVINKGNTLTLAMLSESEQPTSGQSCVLYDGDICVGGGIIQ